MEGNAHEIKVEDDDIFLLINIISKDAMMPGVEKESWNGVSSVRFIDLTDM
jgi:hypothetical protein